MSTSSISFLCYGSLGNYIFQMAQLQDGRGPLNLHYALCEWEMNILSSHWEFEHCSNDYQSRVWFRTDVLVSKRPHSFDIQKVMPDFLLKNSIHSAQSYYFNRVSTLPEGMGQILLDKKKKFPFATKCVYFQPDKIVQLHIWVHIIRSFFDTCPVYKSHV